MQATGSAKAHQREFAGVISALDRNHSQRFLHGGIPDRDDALGQLLAAPPDAAAVFTLPPRAAQEIVKAFLGRSTIEPEFAGEKSIGVQSAKDQVGIGDGGRISAPAITDRSRDGAGALGAGTARS